VSVTEYWYGDGKKWPRPLWSDFKKDVAPSTVLGDCFGQADVPHGIRVTGTSSRELVSNGNMENGIPMEVETGSFMSYGVSGFDGHSGSNRLGAQGCRRNSPTCFGRSIVPIDDGPPNTNIDHALQFRLPSNVVNRVLGGEYEIRLPLDEYLQSRGTLTFGLWSRRSSGYAITTGSLDDATINIYAKTDRIDNDDGIRYGNVVHWHTYLRSVDDPLDTWVYRETSITSEKLSFRDMVLYLGYPLTQASGTLQLTGLSVKLTPLPDRLPPSLFCYGCVLSNNAHLDVLSTGNTTVQMVDSGASNMTSVLRPNLGDGGYLARGVVRAGDRIWYVSFAALVCFFCWSTESTHALLCCCCCCCCFPFLLF
jgi:hypothetical protein